VIKMGDVRIGDIFLSRLAATMLPSRPMAMQVGGEMRERERESLPLRAVTGNAALAVTGCASLTTSRRRSRSVEVSLPQAPAGVAERR